MLSFDDGPKRRLFRKFAVLHFVLIEHDVDKQSEFSPCSKITKPCLLVSTKTSSYANLKSLTLEGLGQATGRSSLSTSTWA